MYHILLPVLLLLNVTLVRTNPLQQDNYHVARSPSERKVRALPGELEALEERLPRDEPSPEQGKHLNNVLEQLLQEANAFIQDGKGFRNALFEKVKETRKKLEDMHVDSGTINKHLMDKVQKRLRYWFKKILSAMA